MQVELEFGNVGLLGGRKTGGPRGPLETKGTTNNKFNPHIAPGWNEI